MTRGLGMVIFTGTRACPRALLHRERLVDHAILDPLEFLHVHPAGRSP